jgi:membrane protein implicated in regulation of membrane protease activity
MPLWLVWLLAGVALTVAEMLSLDLVLIMLAGGALAGAVTALLGAPPLLQGLVFALVSALGLVLVRPIARRHLQAGPGLVSGVAALEGKTALVLEEVGPYAGLVKIDGEHWTARPFEDGQVIDPGTSVEVMKIQGATALVWRRP